MAILNKLDSYDRLCLFVAGITLDTSVDLYHNVICSI